MKLYSAIALVAALALAACGSDEATQPGAGGNPTAGGPSPETVAYFNQVVGDRVFFDTDQHTLTVDAQGTLQRQAEWLTANPGTNATIEGHADERGTRQYNLALGARRANSVRNFLVGQGVDPSRLRAVTFGKERPVALCDAESCWAQNRRSVTAITGGAKPPSQGSIGS